METRVAGETLAFECWCFDRQARVLYRRDATGDRRPVSASSRALEILALRLERPGTLVSKDAIMDAVWPGAAVEPNNLTVQIAALRRVLDEGRSGESCIQTVPGRGYRFVLPVARAAQAVSTPPRLSVVVLPFENLGRDPTGNHLAECITQDLITDLSRLPGMVVVAREPAYTDHKAVDVRKIGDELGVRYALEGSSAQPGSGAPRERAARRDRDWGASLGRPFRPATG